MLYRYKPIVTKWIIDKFRWDSGTIGAIAIAGSNDGSSWVDLDEEGTPVPSNEVVITREFGNQAAFRFYRLTFTRNHVSPRGQTNLELIHLYEAGGCGDAVNGAGKCLFFFFSLFFSLFFFKTPSGIGRNVATVQCQ